MLVQYLGTGRRKTSVARVFLRPGKGDNEWQVDGDLTIRGNTRPVTVDVEFLGSGLDPWGNKRIGFSGVVPEVDREQWGLVWNSPLETGGWLLGKTVRLEMEGRETELDRGLLERVVERGGPGGAGLLTAEVVEVVAGDAEQPAPQRLDRAAEARQVLDGAEEDAAGEVLGLLAVADRGHERRRGLRGCPSFCV